MTKAHHAAALLAAAAVGACMPGATEHTSEEPFMRNGELHISLVEVRHAGLATSTERFVVCRAPGTRFKVLPRSDGIPWRAVPVAKLDSQGIGESESLVRRYLAMGGGQWVAWTGGALRLSLDQCDTWHEFSPWDAIPWSEAGCATRECARSRLEAASRVEYDELKVEGSAGRQRVSFTVRSKALRGEWRVASEDGGRTWSVLRKA